MQHEHIQHQAKTDRTIQQKGNSKGLTLPAVAVLQKKGILPEDPAAQTTVQLKTAKQLSIPATTEEEQPLQKKSNNTGLPGDLKSGIENMSGFAMDDVKVHYNSDKPAQLQAFAYAQGNEIHVAPGQERHLPHEAWHVVQQKQGRVQPSVQLAKDIAVNDDPQLELEADTMGARAFQFKPQQVRQLKEMHVATTNAIQRAVIRSGTYTLKEAKATKSQEKAVTDAWDALNDFVPKAEQNALAEIALAAKDPGYGTAYQKTYLANQTPTRWGYVVEEQLNMLDSTWTHQAIMVKSRPDYHLNIQGIETYADLTTPLAAGHVGDHVTKKLQNSGCNRGDVVAADITYGGTQAAYIPQPLWRTDALAARQIHRNSVKGNEDGAYSEWAQEARLPSEAELMGWTEKQCMKYTSLVESNIDADQFEDSDDEGAKKKVKRN